MDCEQIINEYLKWIKDNTVIKTADEGKLCIISTPFLDRHNDHLEIFLTKSNGTLKISDKGFTLTDLKMSGLEINSPKRESILKTVINGFGVKLDANDELYVDATAHNVGQKKHYLLQAIMAVNDMYNLAQESVYSMFKEDVELYLQSNEIVFSKDIKLSGKSGFDHNVDFLIPPLKRKPERLIKAVNTPKKEQITSAIWAFDDIGQVREVPTKNFVIYNDSEKSVSAGVIDAMKAYAIEPVPWSSRDEYVAELSLN